MYQLRTESKVFGDVEVSVTEIDWMAQQDLWIALTQEVAPGLGGLGSLLQDGFAGLGEQDVSRLVPALIDALRGLSSKKILALQLQSFASAQATIDGKIVPLRNADGLRMVFGPNIDQVYAAWAFALGVIFDRFLSRLRSWVSAAMALVEVKKAELEAAKTKASASSSAPS